MNTQKNAFQHVTEIITGAAQLLGLPRNAYEPLLHTEREILVGIPVAMDDGSVRVFQGCRIQHSTACGPAKGGLRVHPDADAEETRVLAALMTLKCAAAGLPYGGGKGSISVDPSELSEQELHRLTFGYISRILQFIGPKQDILAPDMGTNSRTMAWIVDAYERLGGLQAQAVVTGKPTALGGVRERGDATGRGVMLSILFLLEKLNRSPAGLRVAVQGMGNVGSAAARFLYGKGCLVTAVSDVTGGVRRDGGLDIPELCEYLASGGGVLHYTAPGVRHITNRELLLSDCDLLVPAALENQITGENAGGIRARIVAEAANGPVTAEADRILADRNIVVIPDILANAGGVIVSYFEWLQSMLLAVWKDGEISAELEKYMRRAFETSWALSRQYGVSLRQAAYAAAVSRIAREEIPVCGSSVS